MAVLAVRAADQGNRLLLLEARTDCGSAQRSQAWRGMGGISSIDAVSCDNITKVRKDAFVETLGLLSDGKAALARAISDAFELDPR